MVKSVVVRVRGPRCRNAGPSHARAGISGRRLQTEQDGATHQPNCESGDVQRHADAGVVDDPVILRVHCNLRSLVLHIGRSASGLVSTSSFFLLLRIVRPKSSFNVKDELKLRFITSSAVFIAMTLPMCGTSHLQSFANDGTKGARSAAFNGGMEVFGSEQRSVNGSLQMTA